MEWSESVRFKRLAYSELTRQLKKKKMKALIPQIVQAVCFGTLFLFCACSMVLSRGSFSMSSLISFITSLVFLVEPIQVSGGLRAYQRLDESNNSTASQASWSSQPVSQGAGNLDVLI